MYGDEYSNIIYLEPVKTEADKKIEDHQKKNGRDEYFFPENSRFYLHINKTVNNLTRRIKFLKEAIEEEQRQNNNIRVFETIKNYYLKYYTDRNDLYEDFFIKIKDQKFRVFKYYKEFSVITYEVPYKSKLLNFFQEVVS